MLDVAATVRGMGGFEVTAADVVIDGAAEAEGALEVSAGADGAVELRGEIRVPDAPRWWPHTHGEPALSAVRIRVAGPEGEIGIDAGRVGFRELAAGPAPDHDALIDGLDLHLNGVSIFARGAVWTPDDFVGMAPDRERLRAALERVRDAGMNMVRIPGTATYESRDFHDLCDELGILVWHDFMFANFDYPIDDEEFRATVEAEAREQLAAVAGRPSAIVFCGNSEVEQQVGMLGLDPEIGRGELFGEILPRALAEARAEAIYVPSSPSGGVRPFRPDEGIANYYGVGGYRRPLADARLAEVKFAGECLAFANVPDEAGVEEVLPEAPADVVVHHPRWKAGVPARRGHRLGLRRRPRPLPARALRRRPRRAAPLRPRALPGALPRRLRRGDGGGLRRVAPRRLAQRRRPRPLAARPDARRRLGAGRLLRAAEGGAPAAARGARPDRGLAHRRGAGRDRRPPRQRRTRAARAPGCASASYRDFEQEVGEATEAVELPAHGSLSLDFETILGRFVDASWAYRFGPPIDAIVASLERPGDEPAPPLATALHFPAGRPSGAETAERLGFEADAERAADGTVTLRLRSRRLVWGLRAECAGTVAEEPPGHGRARPRADPATAPGRRRRARHERLAAGAEPARSGCGPGRMNRPFYIGSGDTAAFAVFHPAEPAVRAGKPAVLICPPWGWDDVASYRVRREWAGRLAAAGFPTLRFDLPATGNSAGAPTDTGIVPGWIAATLAAASWLADAEGEGEGDGIAALGIGLGGLLALGAVAAGAPIGALALWGAPGRGKRFVRETQAFSRMQPWLADEVGADGFDPGVPEGWLEAGGFAIGPEALAELKAMKVELPAGSALSRALLLDRDGIAADPELAAALEGAGVAVERGEGKGWEAARLAPRAGGRPRADRR